jgi:hypothetical protein
MTTQEGVEFVEFVGVGRQNKKNRLFPKGDKKEGRFGGL